MTTHKIIAIAAMDSKRVIGNKGKLCWNLPEDMKRFSALTKGHTVVMGRKTFDSLPDKFKPLPGRLNIVISRNMEVMPGHPDVRVFDSFEKVIGGLKDTSLAIPGQIIWIIGGEQIYRASMQYWDEVFLTVVKGEHEGDVYFPEFEDDFKESGSEEYQTHAFINYSRK